MRGFHGGRGSENQIGRFRVGFVSRCPAYRRVFCYNFYRCTDRNRGTLGENTVERKFIPLAMIFMFVLIGFDPVSAQVLSFTPALTQPLTATPTVTPISTSTPEPPPTSIPFVDLPSITYLPDSNKLNVEVRTDNFPLDKITGYTVRVRQNDNNRTVVFTRIYNVVPTFPLEIEAINDLGARLQAGSYIVLVEFNIQGQSLPIISPEATVTIPIQPTPVPPSLIDQAATIINNNPIVLLILLMPLAIISIILLRKPARPATGTGFLEELTGIQEAKDLPLDYMPPIADDDTNDLTNYYGLQQVADATNLELQIPSPPARLIIEQSGDRNMIGRVIFIEQTPFTIGRKENNALCFQGDGNISGDHAVITFVDDAFYIADVGSRQGTVIDGQQIAPQKQVQLPSGSRIRIAQTTVLAFEMLTERARKPGIEVKRASLNIKEAKFSAYVPKQVNISKTYGLFVYAYSEEQQRAIETDIAKFKSELGGAIPKPQKAKQAVALELDTKITVVPECDELEFEPQSLTKKWHGDKTRFDFEFRPTGDLEDETLFIRISIQIAGIEIAHIKSALEIVSPAEMLVDDSVSFNPLINARVNTNPVTPYQRIFISYSRRDSRVAKSYKIVQTALGNDAFLDVDNLRTGEDWRGGLAHAIDKADIFQLFWSEHSASSEYCRHEWEYAVKTRCPEDNCEGFIRPVYWREPMPSPPPELSHLHFRFVPFEDQGT